MLAQTATALLKLLLQTWLQPRAFAIATATTATTAATDTLKVRVIMLSLVCLLSD